MKEFKVTAWLTKNQDNEVEIWKSKPTYDEKYDEWIESEKEEVGSDIFDNLLDGLLDKGECIQVEITRIG